MQTHEDRIRRAIPPTTFDDVDRAHLWELTIERIYQTDTRAPVVTKQRTRRRHIRTIALGIAILVVITGVAAAANPDLARKVLGLSSPTIDRMETFREPAAPEAVPGNVRARLLQMMAPVDGVPAEHQAGTLFDERGIRLLVKHEKPGYYGAIWGATTVTGRVCFVAIIGEDASSPGGAGTCVEFRDDWPISESMHGSTEETMMGGAADEVTQVRIGDAHGLTDATMGRNAFLWLRPHDAGASIIEVELEDGTVIRRELYARRGEAAPREPYLVRRPDPSKDAPGS